MYFTSRESLGSKFASGLINLKPNNPIIVCLKESALMTSLSMAISLHAWIYPLLFAPIKNPDDPNSVIGAVNQNGEFCLSPSVGTSMYSYLQEEYSSWLEDAKREAVHEVNQQSLAYGPGLDAHIMNGRDVILLGDIVTDALELALTDLLLKPLSPKRIFGVAGNVTADVSDQYHLHTDHVNIMDVLSGIVFEDDHYFERRDQYSPEEKRTLALNIATYWD